jgi:hypothetical protein
MKSAMISLIVLIVIYLALQNDVLNIISADAFHYASYALFILVVAAAVYFVGIKKPQNTELPRKEEKDEK